MSQNSQDNMEEEQPNSTPTSNDISNSDELIQQAQEFEETGHLHFVDDEEEDDEEDGDYEYQEDEEYDEYEYIDDNDYSVYGLPDDEEIEAREETLQMYAYDDQDTYFEPLSEQDQDLDADAIAEMRRLAIEEAMSKVADLSAESEAEVFDKIMQNDDMLTELDNLFALTNNDEDDDTPLAALTLLRAISILLLPLEDTEELPLEQTSSNTLGTEDGLQMTMQNSPSTTTKPEQLLVADKDTLLTLMQNYDHSLCDQNTHKRISIFFSKRFVKEFDPDVLMTLDTCGNVAVLLYEWIDAVFSVLDSQWGTSEE